MPKYVNLPLPLDNDDDQNAAAPPEGEAELMPAVGEWAASKIAMIGAPSRKRGQKRVRRPVITPDARDKPKGERDKSEV